MSPHLSPEFVLIFLWRKIGLFNAKTCVCDAYQQIQGLVELYAAVSPLTPKRSIDRHLRAMPPEHYSSPPQRWMVAADA